MFNLAINNNTWPANIQGYDTTDPVLGGVSGQSNIPLQQTSDALHYLYSRLGRYEDVQVISSATTILATDKYKLNYINAAGNMAITLADVATFPTGAILPFKVVCPQGKCVSFITTSAQTIVDGSEVPKTTIWGCDGEEFELVAAGTAWLFTKPRGNFGNVGNEAYARIQPRNTVIGDGSLINRADHARLFEAIQPYAISDSDWLSQPYLYKGFWSLGNGTTTMRKPDLRGMFQRGLDLGRGVRVGNFDNTPGSYEEADNNSHTHGIKYVMNGTDGANNGQHIDASSAPVESNNPKGTNNYAVESQGSQARPKNIGYLPVIYY